MAIEEIPHPKKHSKQRSQHGGLPRLPLQGQMPRSCHGRNEKDITVSNASTNICPKLRTNTQIQFSQEQSQPSRRLPILKLRSNYKSHHLLHQRKLCTDHLGNPSRLPNSHFSHKENEAKQAVFVVDGLKTNLFYPLSLNWD